MQAAGPNPLGRSRSADPGSFPVAFCGRRFRPSEEILVPTAARPADRRRFWLAGVLPGAIGLFADPGAEPTATWVRGVLAEVQVVASTGRNDLHLSGVYWHLPFAYSPERRARLNDAALGLGFGRSLIDAKDNERGLLVQVSRSSHYKPQYAAGYWWLARWRVAGSFKVGAGCTAFVFARSDIFHYLPLPGAVPLVSVGTDRAALYVTFLPRLHDAITGTGNVVYAYARVRF